MTDLPMRPTPEEAEAHMRKLFEEGGFAQPDSVEFNPLTEEVLFRWDEEKLVVALDISEEACLGDDGLPYVPPV